MTRLIEKVVVKDSGKQYTTNTQWFFQKGLVEIIYNDEQEVLTKTELAKLMGKYFISGHTTCNVGDILTVHLVYPHQNPKVSQNNLLFCSNSKGEPVLIESTGVEEYTEEVRTRELIRKLYDIVSVQTKADSSLLEEVEEYLSEKDEPRIKDKADPS